MRAGGGNGKILFLPPFLFEEHKVKEEKVNTYYVDQLNQKMTVNKVIISEMIVEFLQHIKRPAAIEEVVIHIRALGFVDSAIRSVIRREIEGASGRIALNDTLSLIIRPARRNMHIPGGYDT